MTSGIVFVLHGFADEKFAGELAAALAPLPALPVQLAAGARGVQIGGGAAAIVVWTQELCAPAMTRAVLAAVADAGACVALCKGAVPPEALRSRVIACLPARADAAADAEQMRDVIAAAEQGADGPQRRTTPAFGRESGTVQKRAGMAARSAYGLIATLTVAGVVAPMISERAAATNVPPSDAGPNTATTVSAAAAPATVAAPLVARVEGAHVTPVSATPATEPAEVTAAAGPLTPAFDEWVLSNTTPVVAEAPTPVAVDAATPAVDPKRAAYAAHLAAEASGHAAKPGAAALASAPKPMHLAIDGGAGTSPGE